MKNKVSAVFMKYNWVLKNSWMKVNQRCLTLPVKPTVIASSPPQKGHM